MVMKTDKTTAIPVTVAYKLTSLTLKQLDNDTFFQLNARSLKSLDASQLDYSSEASFEMAVRLWREATEVLEKAIAQDKGKELTKMLNKADRLRNSDFSIFKRSLSAYYTSQRPAEQTAYTELISIVKPYQNIHKLEYEKESLKMNALLETLSSAKNREYLDVLGITKLVDNLKASQQECEVAFAATTDIRSNTQRYDTLQVRKNVQIAYVRVMKMCEMLAELHGQSSFTTIISHFNTVREYYRHQLAYKNSKSDPVNEKSLLELPQPQPQHEIV